MEWNEWLVIGIVGVMGFGISNGNPLIGLAMIGGYFFLRNKI
jgi:hypothetical protein